ncbi:Purple acid phosphatase [Aphelenchoides besseyi]|nr:Purple acid phosphatase [Aphelenchoides besseyi]
MYLFSLLLYVILVSCTLAERLGLPVNRKIGWKTENKNHGPYRGQPEQVHIAYSGDVTKMSVTWLTYDDTERSFVEYGENGSFNRKVEAQISSFVDGGKKHTVRYIHRALIENVQPIHRYVYRVGSEYGWSSIYSFVGLKNRTDDKFTVAVYGDMGNINARSLGKLQQMSQNGEFDMIIHNGDLAYDLIDHDGDVGDEFMRQIEPMAAYVPYMINVGNHDRYYNYSHMVNRFTMPNTDHNLFYSFDLGLTHFVAINTELYYYSEYSMIQNQWNWLVNDLKRANSNRQVVPWLIVYMHRSFYCSDIEGFCDVHEQIIRNGINREGTFGLESLLYKFGVDLILSAHEHSYERLWPIYQYQIFNGTSSAYVDPPAPTILIVGSAGCQENTNHYPTNPPDWSAFRSENYGFGRLQIYNRTHLHFEQLMASENKVEDDLWLIKTKHQTRTSEDLKQLKRYGTYVKPSVYSEL